MIVNCYKLLKSKTQAAKTCLCKKDIQLEYLIATPGCSEDLATVSALPEQWVSKRSGPILSKFLEQVEQTHEKVLEYLLNDSRVVNKEFNSKLKTLAEVLFNDIKDNQSDIEYVLLKCISSNESLTSEERTKALTQINIILLRRTQSLTNFKLEALASERARAIELKNKLQLYFQQLLTIGHRPPKTLLHEFDEKIYNINQQVMSNSRSFMLLEIKLRSQANKCLVNARSVLNQASLAIITVRRSRSAVPWSQGQKHVKNLTSTHGIGDISSNNHQNVPHHIDETISQSKLLKEYQEVILKMILSICGQLDELHQEIGNHTIGQHYSMPKITPIQSRFDKGNQFKLNTLFNKDNLRRDFSEISLSSFSNMQKSLSTFGESLNDTYLILYNAGHLCDAHMMRLALAQKLTIATVEDFIVNHDALQFSNEVVTDIAIEQLRAAPDSEKIQQYFDVIVISLDRCTDLYKQHSEIEIDRLEEFTNLGTFLINTLLAEFFYFLECHPRSNLMKNKSPLNSPTISSHIKAVTSGQLLLSKALFQTEIQNVALRNWRNGFLESFEINMSVIPEQLNKQTQLWVAERMDILRIRHSLKLMSHSIRKERIDVARAMRLAELQFHETRLNSHLNAIYDFINDLPTEASECMHLDAPELYPLCWWLSRIQTDINELFARDPLDPEIKRLKICSYSSRLIKHRQLFLDSLDAAVEQYKNSLEYRVQVARISNFRFMSELKLFNEGGKYSASEAMKACTSLVKGADALELCVNRTLDCINHRRSQLLILADQQIAPIQRIVDEVLKSAQKVFLDKKKIVTSRK